MIELEALIEFEFICRCGFVHTYASYKRVLEKQPEIASLRAAYRSGKVVPDEIREFVDVRLLKDFERGFQFTHDTAVAAIAVALKEEQDDFIEEYLTDLAALEISEMYMSSRIARLIKEERNGVRQSPPSQSNVDSPDPGA